MLGERIKKLRKLRKMTLEALAGEELTKGMLSLIENNKAKPSMESLSYIADRLNVEVSDLLNTVSKEDLRETLETVESVYYGKDGDVSVRSKKIMDLVEPIVSSLVTGYETARLLEIYAYALYNNNLPGWENYITQAAKLYDNMNLSTNRASIANFLAHSKFKTHDYAGALQVFLRELKHMEENYEHIDPLARLDLDYHAATLYFAVGDSDAATKIMEEAVDYSRKKQIFYRIDDLYRLATAQAMMERNEEKIHYYLKKLKQYGEFADHANTLHFYELFRMMFLIDQKNDYHTALVQLQEMMDKPDFLAFYLPWYLLEKGKALYYLNNYEESLTVLDLVEIPEGIHHPFDLSIFYVMDVYKGLCLFALGNEKDGRTALEQACRNFDPMPDSPNKKLAIWALEHDK